jgi:RpiR family transcriptional regulator, carbohydrate utilization regulator
MGASALKRDFFARLKTAYYALSASEKKVGELILRQPHRVVELSLAEVAQDAGVSDATAMRFSRSVGYRGWLELKIALVRSLPEGGEEIQADETPFQSIIRKSKEALDETALAFDEAAFDSFISRLIAAGKVLICGSGTSSPIAQELYNQLFRLGINCTVQSDVMMQIMHASLLQKEDLLIVISHSGASPMVMKAVEAAYRTGASLAVITGSRLTPLAKRAEHLLLSVCHEANPETVTSRIAQHAIVQAIYLSLSRRLGASGREFEDRIWDAFFPE